jgi:L-arabinonolactonase
MRPKRTFCKIDRSRGGAADGSTVDAKGCPWNAQVYDGKVIRYTPDGKIDRVIDMPVKKVTSVMFGGPPPSRSALFCPNGIGPAWIGIGV